ncbi:hypothetical protein V8C44DRAFT_340899 [Trichoderma aethiopicum]
MRLRLPPQDAVRCQGQHHLRFRSTETDPCLESVHDTICLFHLTLPASSTLTIQALRLQDHGTFQVKQTAP